jgi:hypothetical protein
VGQALRAPQPLVSVPSGLLLQRQDAVRQYLEARLGALGPLAGPAFGDAAAAGELHVAGALTPWLRARRVRGSAGQPS